MQKTSDQNVPLVARLQSHYQRYVNFSTQVQDIIGKWQAACHYDIRDSSAGWVAVWRLVALYLGHNAAVDQAASIGQGLFLQPSGKNMKGSIVILTSNP